MSRSDVTCKELVELISDYLEGNLDDSTRERLEGHLAGCDGCTNAMTQFRETIRVTGHITEEQVPDQQRDELLATFRRFKEETAG